MTVARNEAMAGPIYGDSGIGRSGASFAEKKTEEERRQGERRGGGGYGALIVNKRPPRYLTGSMH